MKKIAVVAMLLVPALSQAVGIADIGAINSIAVAVFNDALRLLEFARKITQARDADFTQEICNSTQTVSYTNAQKNGLLAEYQNLKQKLQNDFLALP